MKVCVHDLTGTAEVLAGRSGLDREIRTPQLPAPDLAALGTEREPPGGLLHIRPSQSAYLCSNTGTERLRLIRDVLQQQPAGIVISGGTPCKELLDSAESAGIPVLKSRNVPGLRRLLAAKLIPRISIHGVLVQIFNLGTLIRGESAIGKSESALDLILRGHKLVADDAVVLEKSDNAIVGSHTSMGSDLLQIRGLGIINIRALYGEAATVGSCKVGLVVELKEWEPGCRYSLVGLRERRCRILNVNLPYLKLPVKPGRNMATLIEVAARNQMLKNRGIFAAREFNKKLAQRLSE